MRSDLNEITRSLTDVIIEALEDEQEYSEKRQACIEYVKQCIQKQSFVVERLFSHCVQNNHCKAISAILDCYEIDVNLTLQERITLFQLLGDD